MSALLNQFHFIRPEWLWALLPLIALLLMLVKTQSRSNSWRQVIAPELLPFLTEEPLHSSHKRLLIPIGLGALLAVLALAGPTWQKVPQPVHRQTDAMVIVLDLSLSMLATDLKPSRLVSAQRKLIDLLKLRNEGLTGLVVFSGDAHSVSPLTDDSKTIAALVPALSPEIMPVFGSNLKDGLLEAKRLLQQGGAGKQSRIVVLTDGIHPGSLRQTLEQAKSIGYPISVLAIGTTQGAPIPKPDGGFLKSPSGAIVIPKLDPAPLKKIASVGGGVYQTLSLDDADIKRLLKRAIDLTTTADKTQPDNQKTRELDLWLDQGPWLILPLLLLVLPAFRKGWIFAVVLVINLPQPAMAFEWQDLWETPDQQGLDAMQQQQHEQAATLFRNSQWKGSANYRNGNYEQAAQQFSTMDNATAHYNRGNALAKAGKLEQAIKAYDQALERQPAFADATANKNLAQELLKQQQNQSPKDSSDQDGEPSDDADKQQGDESSKQKNDDDGDGRDEQGEQDSSSEPSPDKNNGDENNADQQDAEQNTDKNPDENENEGQSEDNAESENKQKPEPNKGSAADQQKNGDGDESSTAANSPELTEEQRLQKQKTDQMLRRLPDNPGLLFQRKFQQQYLQNKQNGSRQSDQNLQEPMW
ncbi:MAG: VWA domain-containing protein [Pseudomonadales bacterium]|nr:VWA domain-containing protein [Pseudomonadales bacterium]